MSNPEKLKQAQNMNRPDILFSMARAPGGQRLLVGSSDFKVYDLDLSVEKPEPVALEGHSSYVTGIALSGAAAVSGSYDGRLIWWNLENREQLRSVEAHKLWIRGVEATPDGGQVLSVGDDMVCRVWDAEDGKLVRELKGHEEQTPHNYPSMLYCCAISSDGKLAATGDRTGRVVVWELASGKQLATLETPLMYTWDPKARRHSIGGIRSLAFSQDSQLLAVGGMDQVGNIDHLQGKARVEIFDWSAGDRKQEFASETYKGLVECLAFAADGSWLAAAGGDHNGFIQFLDPATGKVIHHEKAPMHVHEFCLDETAENIYAVGHNRIATWTLSEEQE